MPPNCICWRLDKHDGKNELHSIYSINTIVSQPEMHGRSKMAATPVSNTTTCKQCRCLSVGAASNFFFSVSRLALTQRKLRPICIESGQFSPTRSISGETTETHQYQSQTCRFRLKFKKKKKLQNALFQSQFFNLNLPK